MTPSRPRRVAIVGAGIAGLAAAHTLSQAPNQELILFEASSRTGGTVGTLHQAGFTIECGPDSWVSDRPAARHLAESLGLADQFLRSNDNARRTYLAHNRTLTPLPDGLRMMVPTRWLPILESPLFSWQARLAYLREPRRAEALRAEAAARPPGYDESVRSFVTRHFGVEATETIAGPLLAGVFGGDIATLSAAAVLGPFVQLEREHGSLIAPLMARAQQAQANHLPPEPIFTTLRPGLGTLVDRLTAALPPGCLQLHTPVTAIARTPSGWQLTTAAHPAPQPSQLFDAILLATPPDATKALLAPIHPEAAALLQMEATSAITVALCYPEPQAKRLRTPRGFGFLVPPSLSSTPQLLAGTFMHQKFAHRAPPGALFLRGFFGGASALQLLDAPDSEIVEAARAHFARLLGPLPTPVIAVVRRWPRSLPQYSVGHLTRMQALAGHLATLPGLALTGNAYSGVGLPALVQHGQAAAQSLLAHLQAQQPTQPDDEPQAQHQNPT